MLTSIRCGSRVSHRTLRLVAYDNTDIFSVGQLNPHSLRPVIQDDQTSLLARGARLYQRP